VIALGGNALAPSGARSTIHDQFRHARESLGPVVALARQGWGLCLVHGNGPQVGDELLRNERARNEASPLPLGVLVAATAGWIGYMVQQSLENALARAGLARPVTTLLTQVIVDPGDPALAEPRKFIGHEVPSDRAAALQAAGERIARDGRGRLRRVVPSPRPQAVHDLPTILALLAAGEVLVCCGGGGIPVYRDPALGLEGVDAVIDKDLAAAVLARDVGAELLLILTDVDAVYDGWGTDAPRALPRLTAAEAAALDGRGAFGEGSMAPKVRAAIDFVRQTQGRAIITELSRGQDAVRGEAGTTITAESA
jgi:carbamate kinase